MAKQKSKRQGEQVASLRLPVGFQPSPACTKVYPTYTGLHKSVPYNRKKCGQNHRPCKIYRHSRISRPGWTLLGSTTQGEKNMARYAAESKNRGYCCGQADMCLAQPVQNTDTDELISSTTKLSVQFISTLTRSQKEVTVIKQSLHLIFVTLSSFCLC